jgi:hypothetical protein
MALPSTKKIKKEKSDEVTPGDSRISRIKRAEEFAKEFNKGGVKKVYNFQSKSNNIFRRVGIPIIDHAIFSDGLRFPSKTLVYGREHAGKSSLILSILSSWMDRNPSSVVAYIDLDFYKEERFIGDMHDFNGEKGERLYYWEAAHVQDAISMTTKALESQVFDFIVFDPWNMVASEKDVKKMTGDKLIGHTKTADRAGFNADFFRTKSALINKAGTHLWFCCHETTNTKTGKLDHAGGSALRGSLETRIHLKPYFAKVDSKFKFPYSDSSEFKPMTMEVVKAKTKGNKFKSYPLYFHPEQSYLNSYNTLGFFWSVGKLTQSGAWYSLDIEDFGNARKFQFVSWDLFYQENKSDILEAVDKLVEDGYANEN